MGINKKLTLKNDKLYKIFINEKTNTIQNLISKLHPEELSRLIRNLTGISEIFSYDPLRVFHTCFFDPAWLCFDGVLNNTNPKFICTPEEFINKTILHSKNFQLNEFFPGAFTYHLHLSRGFSKYTRDSYFSYFENYFPKFLKLNYKKYML